MVAYYIHTNIYIRWNLRLQLDIFVKTPFKNGHWFSLTCLRVSGKWRKLVKLIGTELTSVSEADGSTEGFVPSLLSVLSLLFLFLSSPSVHEGL